MRPRALPWLVLASCLVATPAAAQCGAGLRNADRAELALRTVHGTAYLEHPTLGFRLLAPTLAHAGDAALEPQSHRWRWDAPGEHVEVRITCADRAADPGFLEAFEAERATSHVGPTTPIAARHENGLSTIEERDASSQYVATRHRVFASSGRTFVLSVTASHRSVETTLRTIASALPPVAIAGADRSRDEIRDAMRRSVADVRVCYENALATQRGLAGRVTASLIIDQAGDVQTAAISATTLGHPRAEACVLDIVRMIRFGPRAEPGVVGVNYPFVFDTQP